MGKNDALRLLQAMIDYFEAGNQETDQAAKAILAFDFENRAAWQVAIKQLRENGEWTGVRSVEAELLAGRLKEIQEVVERKAGMME